MKLEKKSQLKTNKSTTRTGDNPVKTNSILKDMRLR
jgi:hypothetical protein